MQTAAPYNEGWLYLKPEQFNISYLKYILGYSRHQELPEYICTCLDHQVYPNLSRQAIHYQYRLLPIVHHIEKNNRVGITQEITFQGPVIYQLLKYCSHCLAFLLNLSGIVEDDSEHEFLVHSCFNTLTQTALDHIKTEMANTLGIQESLLTGRFAPGYCGWPCEESQKILHLFNLESPEKFPYPLTGVYGLRRKPGQKENIPCFTCTSVTCALHLDFLNRRSLS